LKLFGLEQAIQYVQREKNDFEFALTKEDIRSHVTNVVILIENLVKESLLIYGFLFFDKAYVQKLKGNLDVNVESKLMFGEALRGLSRLYRLNYDSRLKEMFQSMFERNNIYFYRDDTLKNQLLEISSLRGSILHDEQEGVLSLEKYKVNGRICITLSEQVLNQIKSRKLFPDIVKYQSLTETNGKKVINFEDEIGGRLPIIFTNTLDLQELQNRKWYVFKNAKVQKLIPVFSELLALVNEDITDVTNNNKLTEAPTMLALGLLEIKERQVTRWHNIYDGKTSIGRSEENNLIIRFPSISRKHCELIYEQNQVYLIDTTSSHGTYLNGKKLDVNQWYKLTDGDTITLGIGAEMVTLNFHGAK
jgi:hypothetical protein